jgi:hypothetical protein
MDRKDLQFEELHVPKSVRLPLHRLDFGSSGNRVGSLALFDGNNRLVS